LTLPRKIPVTGKENKGENQKINPAYFSWNFRRFDSIDLASGK
jgi:hypothetical protein